MQETDLLKLKVPESRDVSGALRHAINLDQSSVTFVSPVQTGWKATSSFCPSPIHHSFYKHTFLLSVPQTCELTSPKSQEIYDHPQLSLSYTLSTVDQLHHPHLCLSVCLQEEERSAGLLIYERLAL